MNKIIDILNKVNKYLEGIGEDLDKKIKKEEGYMKGILVFLRLLLIPATWMVAALLYLTLKVLF